MVDREHLSDPMSINPTPRLNPMDADAVETFNRILDTTDTSTGGGAASALVGAMGAALIGMVANLSGNRASNGAEDTCLMVAKNAERLKEALLLGGREDSQAFHTVSNAYRMPKGSDMEKQERSEQIQLAMLHATRVPLANAKLCLQVLELADLLSPFVKPAVVSDFLCAKYFAHAGFQGCIANVEINLPQIRDAVVSKELSEEAGKIKSQMKKYEKDPSQ